MMPYDYTAALQKAVRYLSEGMHTEKQVADYLKRKEVEPEILAQVLDTLKKRKYINDEGYAEAYVHSLSGRYSRIEMQRKLRQKGVEYTLASEAAQEADPEQEREAARKAAARVRRREDGLDGQRVAQALARKGFPWPVIRQISEEMNQEVPPEDELPDP